MPVAVHVEYGELLAIDVCFKFVFLLIVSCEAAHLKIGLRETKLNEFN